MKLDAAITEIESLQEELEAIEDRKKEVIRKSRKLGSAVFAAVRHLVPEGTGRVEFQSGSRQYAIEGTGTLTRINEVKEVDQEQEITVTD
jgi:hypothetical protein